MFNIVLYNPEIPQNTGNIVRTCAATKCMLHIIEPMGFSLGDRYLKRAGLDYWDKANLNMYGGYSDFCDKNGGGRLFFLSTKGKKAYHEVNYKANDYFIFGRETAGLPQDIINANQDSVLRIPMFEGIRSLNLSNSVAIVLYEALRQSGFTGFVK